MALFKFRWPGQSEQSEQAPVRRSRLAQAESVDDMRRRARHRLIGAAVLVVLGVIGFPLLFDTQPRPIPVDVPIEIPDRNQVAPMMVPGKQVVSENSMESLPGHGGLGDGEEIVSPTPPAPSMPLTQAVQPAQPVVPIAVPKPPEPPRLLPEQPVSKPTPKPEVKVESKPETKPKVEPKPEPAAPKRPADDAERARALLEGRSVAVPAAVTAAKEGRFIVQVGAFADAAKAAEVRSKLERSGLKTYTQIVNTKDGPRTRVRVGPYEQRDEADKAASRIKGLGLPASVLTL